jgi:hypothetical protein
LVGANLEWLQEAKTGIIELDEHDPDIVGHMITFLYSGNYTVPQPQSEPKVDEKPDERTTSEADSESEFLSIPDLPIATSKGEADTSQELLIHAEVYLIAEEKDISALKQLAKNKYEEALPHGWNSTQFCTSLRLIYDGTPENDNLLWDVAIKFAGKHAKELMDRGEFVELWKEKGEIGVEVFRAFLSSQGSPAGAKATAPSTGIAPSPASVFGNVFGQFGSTPTAAIFSKTGHTCPECNSDGDVETSRGGRRWWCRSCRRAFY